MLPTVRASLLLCATVAACGTSPVPEPGSVSSPVTDAGPDAPALVHDLRAQAAAYARDDIACTSDVDCCAVVDMCQNKVYVVGVADHETVRGLVDDAYQVWLANQGIRYGAGDDCNMCIPPNVDVSCGPAGFCVGVKASCYTPGVVVGRDVCGRMPDAGTCATGTQSVGPAPAGKKPLTVIGCGT